MSDTLIKTTVVTCSILEILVAILSYNFVLASWAFSTLVWCSLYYSIKNELEEKNKSHQ